MIVALADLDYFFAQVEEIMNPSLKGKPLAVCVFSGRTKDSGAIATSNYEARKLGIKSGMPIIMAKKIAPDTIFLPMRKDLYKQVSSRVMKILENFSDRIEVASIDEAYLDITKKVKSYSDIMELGKKIKEEVKMREGLTITVGIAPNKVFAKIMADMSKPDGLGILRDNDVNNFINSLDIGKVPGIGKVLEDRLREIGINYLGDVLKVDFLTIKNKIGKAKANYLLSLANNSYDEPVRPRISKHKGRYVTLSKNTRNIEIILPFLKKAIDEAYNKIDGLPKSIAVVTIMNDLDIISREKSFPYGIDREKALQESLLLLKKILEDDNRQVRRVGVRLGKIYKSSTLDKYF
ncbi:DNA polymerase IV [Acidianus brierleyi]|uniref:DNA polymerase IV n=1 Tax=Acidianus brierleyi TaxID=41673 RepID=A0A2U9IBL0_9CREN|nr:DNA polymerase IV [Acidianus brierleyi]AWR93383.1 DNA polymerase IV [Acidianus brierleyi]